MGSNALRPAIHPVLPEHDIAAGLLLEAADALLAGDEAECRAKIQQANIPVLRLFAMAIMKRADRALFSRRTTTEKILPSTATQGSLPDAELRRLIFARDGWRCRYCG